VPEDINIEELFQLLNSQGQQSSQDMLEQLLLQLILNPVRLTRQRIRLEDNLEEGILFELREGTTINEFGVQEEMQELVINTACFADGNPMNLYGIARCPNCSRLVREDSLRICQFCGNICCISKDCGRYSSWRQRWYCSRKHRFIGFFGVSKR